MVPHTEMLECTLAVVSIPSLIYTRSSGRDRGRAGSVED